MAKISTIKEAIKVCKEAHVTPFIWGHRGLGKSSLVRQLAAENNWGFIDLRCSQLEASDIRGLPDKVDGKTKYLPPVDMPVGDLTLEQIEERFKSLKANTSDSLENKRVEDILWQELQSRYQHGILFIDEVNRAQDDVLQAIFQLVLDRRVGTYTLPPGWCIVAAGNFMEGYLVSGFNDPAFINRFCHITLSGGESTLEEWVNYMSDSHGTDATDIIEFASQNIKHLDGEIAGELGFSIQPSRRSWEMVVRVNQAVASGRYNELVKQEVISGLVGRELAHAFSRYSCPVKPRSLIEKGVSAYADKLKTLDRNQLTGLMWGLVSYCKNRIDEDEIANVCLDFASFIATDCDDKDVVVAFCRSLVNAGNDNPDKTKTAMLTNPRLAQLVSKFNQQNNLKKSFIDRLTDRPDLQQILAKVAWGKEDDFESVEPKPAKKPNKKAQ